MVRITVNLYPNEREALIALARQERRDPRQQAALCIRRDLERHGLLPADDRQVEPQEVRSDGD